MWRCVICFESNQDSVGSTPCGHHFHQGCFNSWASHCRTRNIPPTCPLCTAEAYFLEPGAPPLTTSSDHGQESDSAQEELLSDIEQEESNDEYSYYDSSDAGSGGGVEDSFLTDFTDRSVSWGLSEEDAQGTIEEETKEEEEVDDVQSPSNPMNSIAEMTQELALTEDHPHPRLLQELLGGIGLNPIDFGSVNVLSGGQRTRNQCLPRSIAASLFQSMDDQRRVPLPNHAHFDRSSEMIYRLMVQRVPATLRRTHLQRNEPIDSDVLQHFVAVPPFNEFAFAVFDTDMRGAGVRVYAGGGFDVLDEETMRMNTIPILFEGDNMAGHYRPLFPLSGWINHRPTLNEIVVGAIRRGIVVLYNGHIQERED